MLVLALFNTLLLKPAMCLVVYLPCLIFRKLREIQIVLAEVLLKMCLPLGIELAPVGSF